jgi:Ca-activated chloride channel family protein
VPIRPAAAVFLHGTSLAPFRSLAERSYSGYRETCAAFLTPRRPMHDYVANPWFLLLLPLVPYTLWRWLQQPRPALRYSDTGLLAQLPPGRSRRAHRLGILLRGAALACLILALAGPRWPDRSSRIPTEGIAIMMCVDVSGSMATPDFEWSADEPSISRLEAVKRAFRLFVVGGDGPDGERLEGRPSDLIGLVPFAARPTLGDCPLTLSHSVLVHMIDRMRPERIPGESDTNLSDAIILGLAQLRGHEGQRKVMVLLTDGEHNKMNPSSEATPRQAAQLAANLNVPIYAIDAGGPLGDDLNPAAREANAVRAGGIRSLQEVVAITRGQYFQARDTKALLEVCRKIDGLERQRIESYQYRDHYEAFAWLGLAAFALCLTVAALEMTKWQRLP